MKKLKVISERLSNMDEIIDKLNEIPCQSFSIESILYTYFGIKVRDNNNEYRSLCDVINDVSKIYWTLDDDTKDNLRKLIMGYRCSKERFESYMGIKPVC